ncbi:PREDICTED: uncharacterized protein LOC109339324 isoform X2 [Lupinus angustifolius]|uniref:uncharacterized protein LOC109339324 isoform X2 n=1 Tax=Lupinus angustifolius TaxID=3871 RepID=UPI00092F1FAB|nr:PREDICTED: uncharacterized protein LOC109339324 isoform X2 [Lupinus angustifolius]
MWQVLLAAAVAGSTGFITIHFLNNPHYESDDSVTDLHTRDENNGVFVFSTSESLRQDGESQSRSRPIGSENGVKVPNADQKKKKKKGGKKLLPFWLNKRRITNRVLVSKVPSSSSSKDNSFGMALGFGIMYMMSAEKTEINKLNNTVEELALNVQELKYELDGRKLLCAHQILDSGGDIDTNSCKISGKHDQVMPKKTNREFRGTDVNIWSTFVNDGGECGSSALTEEPEPRVLEMDQLEAELEFELQKLSGCTVDGHWHEEIRPTLDELEVPDEDPNFNYSQFRGALPSELNQKLNNLLIKQQENQIAELESELHLTRSNFQQKEAELQALKECVKHLTDFSLSTVSDDETHALNDTKETSDLEQSVIQGI